MVERTSSSEAVWDGPRHPATDGLSVRFQRSDLARHLAFFYESPARQRRVAATFVKAGLERGNRCLYFVDANTRSTLERALRRAGVDVDSRVDAGDLRIRSGCEAYREARFDPTRLIDLLEDASKASVADAYEGLWVAGEVSWCFHTDLDYDHVVDFEAEFDARCPDLPITSLCQYDLDRFGESSIAKALWTHRQVVYRDAICENPFYVPPDEFRSSTEGSVNVRLMLEQTYRLAEATRQLERREQRLAVVDRILRHDVRNHLNVTRGLLDLVRRADEVDDEQTHRLTTATDHLDRVFETASKARFVQQTLGSSNVTRVPLRPFVGRAVERVRSSHAEVDIDLDIDVDVRVDIDVADVGTTDESAPHRDEGPTVVADHHLDIALAELLRYVVRLQDSDSPRRVTLRVVDTAPDALRLDVSYPGPPVPANDRQVLQEGVETPLSHCTGLELWLVKWIVENGEGAVDLPAGDGEPIRVLLKRPVDGVGDA